MSEEIKVSEEAERLLAVIGLNAPRQVIINEIQLLLNQRDTKISALEAEVGELRKKNYELSGKAGFLSGVIQGVTHWNIPPELKTILHGELFKMTTALNSTKGEK